MLSRGLRRAFQPPDLETHIWQFVIDSMQFNSQPECFRSRQRICQGSHPWAGKWTPAARKGPCSCRRRVESVWIPASYLHIFSNVYPELRTTLTSRSSRSSMLNNISTSLDRTRQNSSWFSMGRQADCGRYAWWTLCADTPGDLDLCSLNDEMTWICNWRG